MNNRLFIEHINDRGTDKGYYYAGLGDVQLWLAEQGMVAVPLEPTKAMTKAGKVAVDRTTGCSGEHDQPCSYCDDGLKHPDGCGYAAVAAYKAMIAAQESTT